MTTTNPTLLAMPIAVNGTKNTIPATQAAAGDGLLSQSTGFPPETALPLGAGGKAPTREDFNGALNLLSGVAFYAQKGFWFFYDDTQDYFEGCVIRDATDGKLYEAVQDVAAGGGVPSADDGTNWRMFSLGGVPLGSILPYSANVQTPPYGFLYCEGQAISRTMYADLFALIGTTYGSGDGSTTFNLPNLIEAAMLNGSYTKTSYTTAGSATFTASKTGFYKITVKGAGGGGQGGGTRDAGGAGSGGGVTVGYAKMAAGDTASIVVGAGGTGGAKSSTTNIGSNGLNGGDTTAVIGLATYTGGGGQGGNGSVISGGTGDFVGAKGGHAFTVASSYSDFGGICADNGGTGGIGGSSQDVGANGGDGYATIEYIGISTKYMVKAYDAPTPSSAQIDLSQYAADLAARLTREQTPAFNRRDVITTSGTYTAPVTGWYKITVKGGGGGGAAGLVANSTPTGGGGGGEGGTAIGYEKLTAGDTVSVVIGAGGAGGTSSSGGNGGNTTAIVNTSTYTGGGGSGGTYYQVGGAGGAGGIIGAAGGIGNREVNGTSAAGGSGGGEGGGAGGYGNNIQPTNGSNGGGGGGAGCYNATKTGGVGGAGYVEFSYFDPSLN